MTYRLLFHPSVALDLEEIATWITEYAGAEAGARRIAEIEAAITSLKQTPHKGSLRTEIAPHLLVIPAGRKGVIAFSVDDARQEVLVHAVTYAGADWSARSRSRT